jgi:hypothetical protein
MTVCFTMRTIASKLTPLASRFPILELRSSIITGSTHFYYIVTDRSE